MNNQSTRVTVLHLLIEWILGTAGVLGSVFCLITAFELPAPPAILWLVPALMAVLLALFRIRRGRLAALLTGAGLPILLFLTRKTLFPSAAALWNLLADHYSLGYDFFRTIHPTFIYPEPAETFAALLALAVLQTWICALALARWRRTWPALLALLPGIAPCFVLLDTPPALLPLMAVCISLLLQILSQNSRRREDREAGRAVLWSAVVVGVLMGAMMLVFPRENFRAPLTWEELANEFASLGQKLNERGNISAGLSGNPAEVDLENLMSLPNRASRVMTVTSDYQGTLYLRGSAYNRFTGSGWERGEEREWDDRVLFPFLQSREQSSLSHALPTFHLSVKTTYREVQLFTTYELLSLPKGGRITGDEYYRNVDRSTAYSMTFTQFYQTGGFGGSNPDMSGLNPEYEQWVEDNCLELPEETRQGVLDWWQRQAGWDISNVQATGEYQITVDGISVIINPGSTGFDQNIMPYDADWTARAVAALVSQCAEYSRNPETLPEGADFCTWFLNEAETGYCVHYATSTVAILRALGIPARYVTGYVVNSVPGKSTEITNIQAHAWVEYFNRGYWHMLEATPGDATEFTGQMPEEPTQTEPEPSETAAPTETAHVPVTETEYITPTETRTPGETVPEKDPGGYKNDSGDEPRSLPTGTWILFGVIALCALAVLRRRLARRRRSAKLARAGINQKAVLLYRRCLRLSRLTGGAISPEAEAAANKAAFSQHSLEPEELGPIREALSLLVARAQVSKGWKWVYFRYILAVI